MLKFMDSTGLRKTLSQQSSSLYNKLMSESDNSIGSRHSFRKSAIIQSVDMARNEFGQITLSPKSGERNNQVQAYVDPEIGLAVKQDIFDSPKLQALASQMGFDPSQYLEADGSVVSETDNESNSGLVDDEGTVDLPQLDANTLAEFRRIAASLQEISPKPKHQITTQQAEQAPVQRIKRTLAEDDSQRCIDPDCKAPIKVGSKFCTECGRQQLAKHCVGCGFPYEGTEKFCPNCGIKR